MKVTVQTTATGDEPQLTMACEVDPSSVSVVDTHLGLRVRVDNWPLAGQVGGPAVPRKDIWVALPEGCQAVGLETKIYERTAITDEPATLAPLPTPQRDVPDISQAPIRTACRLGEYYAHEKDCLPPLARLVETRRLGNSPAALIQVCPLAFDAGGRLELATKFEIEVALSREHPRREAAPSPVSDEQRARLNLLAMGMVVNPGDMARPSRPDRFRMRPPSSHPASFA